MNFFFFFWYLENSTSDKSRLPKPEEFSKALYTIDIGQNDIAGILQKGKQEIQATIPFLIAQFSAQIRVSQQNLSIQDWKLIQ